MKALILFLIFAPALAFAYSNEYRESSSWIEGYRPLYFLYGNPDSKIELSAKAQLYDEKKLYFAYTQTMFWDLPHKSSPITDVNFNPELFYRFAFDDSWIDAGILEHESNGRDGLDSRAWNRSYVRYVLKSDDVVATFKAWVAYKSSFDDANSDLLFYRGLYELELTYLFAERSDVTLRLWAGGPSHVNPFSGGQELTVRFGGARGRLVPLWTVQVFNGYGEDLLTYNQRRTMLRAGLSY